MTSIAAYLRKYFPFAFPVRDRGGARYVNADEVTLLREKLDEICRSVDEQVELRTRKLAFLYDFSKAVSYTLDYRQLIQRILEGVSQLFDRGVCGFMLLEDGSAHVAVKSLSSEFDGSASKVGDVLISAMSSLIGRNIRRKDVSLSDMSRASLPAAVSAGEHDILLRSYINVPFVVRGEAVGMINVSSDREDAFSESDIEFMYAIARDASAAFVRLRNVVAEEKLVMEAMVFSMAEGVVLMSDDGHVVVCNPRARALLRLHETPGFSEEGLADEFRRMGLELAMRESHSTGKAQRVDVVIPGEDRAIIRAEIAAVKDERGMPHGTVLVLRDVTKDVEIDHMKSEFISTVSHEMRTPLSLTREGLSLVLDGLTGEISDRQRTCLMTARSNIDRLNRIVGDLLDVSKIESGKVQLNRVQLDVREVVAHVEGVFRKRAVDAGIELKIDFPEGDIKAFADHDRIIQVFTNLVGNALKFTEKGTIEISIQLAEDFIECSVSDTGMGIKKDDMPYLFDRFRQFGRMHGPGEKGTGLGLSIVKGIVELHGGTISAHSAYGEGSRFIFTIPRFATPRE
jgi:signal transduction histidine kinase